MLIMNNQDDLAFQTLSAICSLTNILNDLPLPSPSQNSMSSQSLLYEPRLSEEAHSWLSSEDDILVHSLTIAMSSTNTDNIEFKESSGTDEVDHNALPPLIKAVISRNEVAFKNKRGFLGIFRKPSYIDWEDGYDTHFNYGFNSTTYQLSGIMTPSPEQPKNQISKDNRDDALRELHDTFPEFKFSSDAMQIPNKIPSNITDLYCTQSLSPVKIDKGTTTSEIFDQKKKKKKKKHKESKHPKTDGEQYSIIKCNPESQKLVLSLIKPPEDHKKSKKKKKKHLDREEEKNIKETALKTNEEPLQKIKLNIKLSGSGDNAQIIPSCTPLNEMEESLKIVLPETVADEPMPTNQDQELSLESSGNCVTSTPSALEEQITIVDEPVSQYPAISLLQEPDHHMWNYPVYSNMADDQFDLSMPIDISGNNFSDFITDDDLLSPLHLNISNNLMLNSVLRDSMNEPFLLDYFDNNCIDMRSTMREPGGLASYLSNSGKDTELLMSDQVTAPKRRDYDDQSRVRHQFRKSKRRKNELDGLKVWFVGAGSGKDPALEGPDATVIEEPTSDKAPVNQGQTFKEISMKRKRSLRPTAQNSAFVFENDDEYSEATNLSANAATSASGESIKNPSLTYVDLDEGEDSQRLKKRKKDDDEPFEMKLKDPNDVTYLPLKKSLEKIRKRRERVPAMTKSSNTSSKVHLPSDMLGTNIITESTTYQHFISLIDSCLEDVEHVDLMKTMKDQSESKVPIPPDVLLSRESLQGMCNDIAKLKATCSTNSVPIEKLSKINSLLMLNICSGSKICLNMPENDNDEVQNRNFREYAIEKIGQSLDASYVAMSIMTSPEMPKEVYIEEVIDSVVTCVKYQLTNLIFPDYDPAYRAVNTAKENQMSIKVKRAREKDSAKSKSIIYFYNRLVDIISSLSELVVVQTLTDNVILQLSSLGISVFFVENINEVQLVSLRLITTIFSKYDKHRDLIVEDILSSLSHLPSSKKNLRNYRLNSEDSIQMLTSLSLLLVQSVINPCEIERTEESKEIESLEKATIKMDKESLLESSYNKAIEIIFKLLKRFLMKSTSKGEDDYKAIFEHFVTDLLLTVNKPEWPAAELMLNILGSILGKQLVSKQCDQATRVICIDYLGTVAATLRRDAVASTMNEADIDSIVKNLITGCKSSDEEDEEEEKEEEEMSKQNGTKRHNKESLANVDKLQILRDGILDYLGTDNFDQSAKYARQFYLGQWFSESLKEVKVSQENQNKYDKKNGDASKTSCQVAEDRMNHLTFKMFGIAPSESSKKSKTSRLQKLRGGKEQDSSRSNKLGVQLKGTLDYEDACLACRYISSLKPFSQSFDIYLTLICRLLSETSVAVRTKAMRCLSAVVEADPSILCRQDIERSVHLRFLDPSASVREAAVELVGKYLLTNAQLIPQYYPMIAERILDKGTSVRKRVIRIFRDICVEHTEFPKIPEICVKMIRRINDEDAIKKLVNEVFQNMWFSPVREKETLKLLQKVMNITDVVSACTDLGYEWFDQLLGGLLKKDDSDKMRVVERACKQIVDCLVQNILRLEEISDQSNQRLVSCLATLNLFTKIRPELMVHHAMTLQPYLNIRKTNNNDTYILHYVARILEVTVPLIEHPSESYICQIEEDMVKLILNGSRMVLESCVACLASTVNKVSRNYSLVKDCFERLFNCLLKFRLDKDPNKLVNVQKKPMISRALFTVGLLCKYFDFNNLPLENDINNNVFETLIYFAEDNSQSCDIRMKAISGIGFLCIRHRELLTSTSLSIFYHNILLNRIENVNNEDYPELVGCVLDNLSLFLVEEDDRMRQMDSKWNNSEQKESLKEMGDMSSGISSHVAQLYLHPVLENVLQPWISVRAKAVGLIVIIIRQGLVNPIGSVPHLIGAQTDPNPSNRVKADNELAEIDKRFLGFINMKAVQGMKLSAKMHEILAMYDNAEYRANWCGNRNKSPPIIIRGVVDVSVDIPMALNHSLYSMLRSNKQFRRSFLYALLTIFGEMQSRLSLLIYVSDNLAQFSYQSQEEPLYLVHHIVIMVSSLGPNIIQQIHTHLFPEYATKESLDLSHPNKKTDHLLIEDEEDPDVLVQRMQKNPGSLKAIRECVRNSRGCVLLVSLKQYLRELYSLTDAKIQKYSPSDTGKMWDRQLSRRANVRFNPISTLGLTEEAVAQEKIYQKFASDGHQDDINLDAELYPNESRILIKKFLILRQLVNAIDRLDIVADSDDEAAPAQSQNKARSQPFKSESSVANGSANGISAVLSSQHSAVLQGKILRVELSKLDLSSIPQYTQRRPPKKKTTPAIEIIISSDDDSDELQKPRRSNPPVVVPSRKLSKKSSSASRQLRRPKPKSSNARFKSPFDSSDESRDDVDNAGSDPDFVG